MAISFVSALSGPKLVVLNNCVADVEGEPAWSAGARFDAASVFCAEMPVSVSGLSAAVGALDSLPSMPSIQRSGSDPKSVTAATIKTKAKPSRNFRVNCVQTE